MQTIILHGSRILKPVSLSEHGELVGGADQFLRDARVVGSVASIVDYHELGVWPYAAELPGVADRCLKVKASVHHDPRDVEQRISVAE